MVGHLTQKVWLKERCPRPGCGGNLYLEREEYGAVAARCLMCGREIKPPLGELSVSGSQSSVPRGGGSQNSKLITQNLIK